MECSERTARNKLKEVTDFSVTEAIKINEKIFDNKYEIGFLFRKDKSEKPAKGGIGMEKEKAPQKRDDCSFHIVYLCNLTATLAFHVQGDYLFYFFLVVHSSGVGGKAFASPEKFGIVSKIDLVREKELGNTVDTEAELISSVMFGIVSKLDLVREKELGDIVDT